MPIAPSPALRFCQAQGTCRLLGSRWFQWLPKPRHQGIGLILPGRDRKSPKTASAGVAGSARRAPCAGSTLLQSPQLLALSGTSYNSLFVSKFSPLTVVWPCLSLSLSLALLRQGIGSCLGPPALKAPHMLWGLESLSLSLALFLPSFKCRRHALIHGPANLTLAALLTGCVDLATENAAHARPPTRQIGNCLGRPA